MQRTRLVSLDLYRQERDERLKPAALRAGQLCTARMIEYPEADHPDDDFAMDFLVEIVQTPGRFKRALSRMMPTLAKVTYRHLPPPESNLQFGQEQHNVHHRDGEFLRFPPFITFEEFAKAFAAGVGTYVPKAPQPEEQGYLLPASHHLEEDFAPELNEALKRPALS